MRVFNVQLSNEEYESFQQQARERGVSMSALVRARMRGRDVRLEIEDRGVHVFVSDRVGATSSGAGLVIDWPDSHGWFV